MNDIRNEPIIQKFDNGSISLNDFLSDSKKLKSELKSYGISNKMSDALLASQVKIIEVRFSLLSNTFYL